MVESYDYPHRPGPHDPTNDPAPAPGPVDFEQLVEAGVIQPVNDDSPWWAGTKAFIAEAGFQFSNAAADEIPYLGQAKGAAEFVTGKDIRGDDLGVLGRAGAAMNMVPGGGLARKSLEGVTLVGKGIGKLFGFGGKHSQNAVRAAANAGRGLDTYGSQTDELLEQLGKKGDNTPGSKADDFAEPVNGAPKVFRGGKGLKARLGVDVKPDVDGLIQPLGKNGKPQGLSVNIDPKDKFIDQYGGAFPVNGVPDGLQVIQSGRPGHFVIAPTKPLSFDEYQKLLDQVDLGNFNDLP